MIVVFLATVYTRERTQLDTAATSDQIGSQNSPPKRTASFVCLTVKDFPTLANDQSISSITGTLTSHTPIFKTLPQRRVQRNPHRQQQQQQPRVKPSNGLEIDKMPGISPPIPPMPNLMELATRSTPLPNLTSSINHTDLPMMDSPSKHSYETHVDSNGVNHHRLHSITDNLLRPNSKIETLALRAITPGTGVKMPAVNHGNHKKSSSHKTSSQLPLATIESVLRERSMVIANENAHQPDAMERVNHALKQLYLPTERSKRP